MQLREATAESHDRVDRLFAPLNLGHAGDYGRFLAAQATVLLPLEQWLDEQGATDLLDYWPERRRADLLRDDLANLGQQIPQAEDINLPATPAAMLGAAYVLEGSRLGGALLARQVGADLPRRFLAGERAASWRGFVGQLDRRLQDPADLDAAIEGARTVFEAFERAGRRVLG
ncbi:biliverdin-producing heme oxygenase [Sphingomonas astaxanthinifaciens]|uniref:Biliverdin-producing heme oxygenase n=1 Tax=Sphingomonas astaxanthinifaciens DSM 22298 TaxID=1123267 RepID=A0ABQ5Z670_9SPHN|nr:biliverdin-producing heme oxygenase [Sphingomonas astaxanthinifaciens]GLR47507.1 biliverdin-producing heme oxygenase [Sphingomonas astaxanthinifaciens DSM 22298]